MICSNISANEKGHLTFGGQDTVALAKRYGTPLYVMDEVKIRENCRVYTEAFKKYFGNNSRPIYASKAASFKRMYTIVAEEEMGCDVVSIGEIYTAYKAGFPLENAFFHSNNKTDEDIRFAMEHGVGYFVVDCFEELNAISQIAQDMKTTQKILLRLTPGIDTHTYEAINTGKVDSKFGSAIETGQAREITAAALKTPAIELMGFHCHIGSQVFDSDTFIRSSEIMLNFIAEIRDEFGYEAQILNLGGGYGVRYTEEDPTIDIDANIKLVSETINSLCEKLSLHMPAIIMEPGRSIVADAGMTLYTAGSVKVIPGYKKYVSVDGGMTDNPRYALYQAVHTVLDASHADEKCDFECSLVGRCCESGDIISGGTTLPSSVKRGDIIAVCTTGAYNYSMASNYNRIGKPAVVMVNGDDSYVAVKRETLDDIIRNDI